MGKRALIPIGCVLVAVAALALLFDVRFADLFGGDARSGGTSDAPDALDAGAADAGEAHRGPTLSTRPAPVAPSAGGAGISAKAAEAGPVALADLGGRVVASDGRLLAGVRVLASDGEARHEAATDAEGRFRLALPPGRYDLVFRGGRDGALLVRSFLVDGRARADLSFTLGGASRVVVEAKRDGVGLAGAAARVRLRFDGVLETVAEGATDLAGRFDADGIPSGPYAVELAATGNVTLSRSLDVAGEATVAFTVPAPVRVSGVVYDAASKAGVVATLDLTLQTPDGAVVHATGASAGDGRFDLDAIAAKPSALLVLSPEHAPFPQPGPEWNATARALDPVRRGEGAILDLPLRVGGLVRGVVTTAAGPGSKEPVADLAVRLRPKSGSFPGRSAVTAADGTYEVRGVGPGGWQMLVETPGWYVVGKDEANVRPGTAETRLDLEAASSGVVSGHVLLADGRGAGGARVWLVGGGGPVRSARRAGRDLEAYAAPDGSFSLSDVPPNVNFRVRAALGEAEAVPSDAYNLGRAAVPPLRMVLRATGGLSGDVSDLATREPVAGARVTLEPVGVPAGRTGRTVSSDAAGRFEVAGLIPGRWKLVARKNDYLPGPPVEVDLPAESREATARVTVDPGLAVGGVVVDAHGAVLANARVRLEGPEDGADPNRPARRQASTDARGAFRWQALRPGSYTLTARSSGFLPATLTRLRGGEERLRVVLERRPPP
jgi:hypothetical protein